MKGLVFTEFLEMVEEEFGFEMAETIVDEAQLPSGGAYTAVGTYDHSEMVSLLTVLSAKTQKPVDQLLRAYGHYLFGTFEKGNPTFLASASSAFDFLESIEQHIHVEVLKLYPDAELPTFSSRRLQPDLLELIYQSERKMGAFALGLIEQSLVHYREKADVNMEKLNESGTQVRFLIKKEAG